MIDQTALLTRLQQIFDFNSRGLKSMGLISYSAYVRHSRGKFDQIRRLIMTNSALIGSRSSLNVGELWWTQDLPSNSLNCFTNWSKVKKRREEHRFLKRNFPWEMRAVWSGERPIDGHNRTMTVGHQSRGDRAMIAWRSSGTISRSVGFRRPMAINRQGESDASTCLSTMRHDHDQIKAVGSSLTRSTVSFSALDLMKIGSSSWCHVS